MRFNSKYGITDFGDSKNCCKDAVSPLIFDPLDGLLNDGVMSAKQLTPKSINIATFGIKYGVHNTESNNNKYIFYFLLMIMDRYNQ